MKAKNFMFRKMQFELVKVAEVFIVHLIAMRIRHCLNIHATSMQVPLGQPPETSPCCNQRLHQPLAAGCLPSQSSSASRMALLQTSKYLQGSGPGGVNPDLASERQTASFSVEKLTAWLDGGAEHTRLRRAVGE